MPLNKCSGRSYKIAIIAVFAVFLTGMAASVVLSAKRGSRVVDAEYYQNGLQYDRTKSGAGNPGLRWSLAAAIVGPDLLVRVNDERGVPVAGGRLRFEPARGATPNSSFSLSESAPGIFRARRPPAAAGELQGTLLFTKGEATASRKVVLFD